ncbi:MAG: hypothetical protein HC794_03545 [Nitrospiraceae bacterium]|nr:hypothetical protein [Nitrospiraceae bacterium]
MLKTGHIFFGDPRNLIIATGTLGAAVASEVEAATDSAPAGTAVNLALDMLNPVADIVELESFLEEIGTDIIEKLYDLELEDQEIEEILDVENLDDL